jgi:hypothetical protein
MRLDVSENPDTQNVTKSKRGFQVQLFAMGLVEPRETTTLQIAAKDVPKAFRDLQDAAVAADARILMSQLNENDRQNVSATLSFDVRKEHYAKIDKASPTGAVLSRSGPAQDVEARRRLQAAVHRHALQPLLHPAARDPHAPVVVDQVERR